MEIHQKYEKILLKIAEEYKNILKKNLVGIYIHGSLAFGCFNPYKSDLDFIVVVNNTPSLEEKEALIKVLLNLSADSPAKGYEMSVVLKEVCDSFIYPTPFELHYSIAHKDKCLKDLRGYCNYMHGTDKDLAAHFTVIKSVGITLVGKSIEEVFGIVPQEDYLDSIKLDVEDAANNVSEDPVYTILNLCRVLAYKRDGLILSKEQGGLWAMYTMPEKYLSLISKALKCYKSVKEEEFNKDRARDFCNYMLEAIN